MPLAIIFFTTSTHIGFNWLLVWEWEWGIEGGALALSLTYFMDIFMLFLATKMTAVGEFISFDAKQAFIGWVEYL
jgi:Na+-driven multidrug efflux pump